MEKLNTTSIIQRLKSETPIFWIKVRRLMMGCATLGASLIAIPVEYTAWLPTNTISILITVGAVGTALASLTVNPNETH